jgi:hypothetical protein
LIKSIGYAIGQFEISERVPGVIYKWNDPPQRRAVGRDRTASSKATPS